MLLIIWLIITLQGCVWIRRVSGLFLGFYLAVVTWWGIWFYLYGE